MAQLHADGTKQISLTRNQFVGINKVLETLFQQIKDGAAILADESGLVVSQKGSIDPMQLSLLTTLVAADFVATKEMAKLLGEKTGFKRQYHEGERYSISVTGVGETYLLAVIFSQETTYGMVRVQTQKAVGTLAELVADDNEVNQNELREEQAKMDVNKFQTELSGKLDNLLGSK